MQLYLLINQTCNLKCKFCIRGENKLCDINLEYLEKIIAVNDFSKYTLIITGGEPSISKNLIKVIEICYGKFKKICINTNGVNGEWIDKLRQTDIHIQISIDGTAEVHNSIRGNGNDIFSKIESNVQKIWTKKIPYCISTTVDKYNYRNIYDLVNYIPLFQGMRYWKISPVLPFGCASIDNIISVNEWNELVDYILDHATVRVKMKKLFSFELLDKYIDKGGKAPSIIKNCGDVRNKIYVYPDFTVYPCTCLTDFPIGNLLNSSLKDILESDAAKIFSGYKVREGSVCSKCKYLQYCNGGCIGMSYNYFGKLGEGDFRCPLIKK